MMLNNKSNKNNNNNNNNNCDFVILLYEFGWEIILEALLLHIFVEYQLNLWNLNWKF